MNSYSSPVPDSLVPRPWYVSSNLNPGANTRLFFFPHAGGGPSVFGKWLGKLPSSMEGYIAHYPGRGSRHHEPSIPRLSILVDRLYEAIQPLLDKPFAFFGHSLGGLVAFELTRQLRQQKLPQPRVLFVSACGAPHLRDPYPDIHALPDSDFMNALQRYNGIPSELLQQSDLMQLFLPMLRADVEAAETYHYSPGQPPLGCPIITFGGLDDPHVDRESLEGWASHTNVRLKSQYFPGDHFFINTAREAIIESIVAELESSSDAKG